MPKAAESRPPCLSFSIWMMADLLAIFLQIECVEKRGASVFWGGGNGPDEDAQLWVVLYCVVLC